MAVMDGKGIAALDNLNVQTHPFWFQIMLQDLRSNDAQFGEVSWIDSALWQMDKPEFACPISCLVDFGVVYRNHVSDETWTKTITQAPLTYSA
ncbi:uncharacterized protein RSE6_03640 [Rhynchosporium secalis]|uniref:Uncharacterized protein n=1 Tax=Rhynchosporium secalis TaxID=38038 RepID=A0A1E1M397_RHYSE|nr:uncharacterized protein RSE6_03640 [Rhynchosporium secalis]